MAHEHKNSVNDSGTAALAARPATIYCLLRHGDDVDTLDRKTYVLRVRLS